MSAENVCIDNDGWRNQTKRRKKREKLSRNVFVIFFTRFGWNLLDGSLNAATPHQLKLRPLTKIMRGFLFCTFEDRYEFRYSGRKHFQASST